MYRLSGWKSALINTDVSFAMFLQRKSWPGVVMLQGMRQPTHEIETHPRLEPREGTSLEWRLSDSSMTLTLPILTSALTIGSLDISEPAFREMQDAGGESWERIKCIRETVEIK